MAPTTPMHDVVILGGGHNALVAAAYLARAGRSVTVLERLPQFGGAAVSAQAFTGIDARLSRYSYLVSLLPERIIRDLGLRISLTRRRISSYTPLPGSTTGLLIDNEDPTATARSFAGIGAGADASAFADFYAATSRVARALFPTVTEPLLSRSEARRAVGDDGTWRAIMERPIGEWIEASVADDLVRGVVLTDALIGTFASAHDTSLAANRCFLYHVIGGGTGEWNVPVGGMGSVSGELARAARGAGATLITDAEVTAVDPDGEVTYRVGDDEYTIGCRTILSGVAPAVLARLLGEGSTEQPVGAQVKVNLMLRRLPKLLDSSVDPIHAFGGTFHINEGYSTLEQAYRQAASGSIPDPLPAEIYCHSLTDPTILSPELAASGAHTLTVFALHTPSTLVNATNADEQRTRLERAVIASLDSVLAEPIESLLMTDASGRPTIETKTTFDLEQSLALPGGNIFHGPLEWPFAEDGAELGTPAERWGVGTRHPRILVCGSGARRGGAVSGIGGHNAAMAVLEDG